MDRLSVALWMLCVGLVPVMAGTAAFDRPALGADIDTMMVNHYLKRYYPRVINPDGGIRIYYDRQFNPVGGDSYSLDMQSRHLWSASMGAMLHPEYKGFREAADAAYFFIRDKMWDKNNGGSGLHSGNGGHWEPGEKSVYSNGFALVGLSAYYMATGDTMALHIAKTTFKFIDDRNYDGEFGWWFGSGFGDKNQDIGHHWLEGMAWLHIAWPDHAPDSAQKSLLKKRVKEGSDLFLSSRWVRGDGSIVLNQNREMSWGNGENPGLCAEDVYLIYFYYQAIGETPSPEGVETLKRIHGFARTRSTPGQHFGSEWWYDAELLASYCFMGTVLDAGESYLEDAKRHWEFIKRDYFDPEHGGWFRNPNDAGSTKGDSWQATYHGFKTMLFCRNWLMGSPKGWMEEPAVATKSPGRLGRQANRRPAGVRKWVAMDGFSGFQGNPGPLHDIRGRLLFDGVPQGRKGVSGMNGIILYHGENN